MTSLGRRELELASGRNESRDKVSVGICLILGVAGLVWLHVHLLNAAQAAWQQLPPVLTPDKAKGLSVKLLLDAGNLLHGLAKKVVQIENIQK